MAFISRLRDEDPSLVYVSFLVDWGRCCGSPKADEWQTVVKIEQPKESWGILKITDDLNSLERILNNSDKNRSSNRPIIKKKNQESATSNSIEPEEFWTKAESFQKAFQRILKRVPQHLKKSKQTNPIASTHISGYQSKVILEINHQTKLTGGDRLDKQKESVKNHQRFSY